MSKLTIYFYNWIIEPLLKRTKQKVASCLGKYNLSPFLDVCCGTGAQCHLSSYLGQTAFGIDIDIKLLRFASSQYPELSLVCSDASFLPFKDKCFNGLVISYSIHDKNSNVRKNIIREAKRVLKNNGKIILVDYENPWNFHSKLGRLFTFILERMAGTMHFNNCQDFLRSGGLRSFIRKSELVEVLRFNIEPSNSAIVVTKPQ